MRIVLEIEATPNEMNEIVTRVHNACASRGALLETRPDPRTLTALDARRYRYTGTVSDHGTRECYDVRTGRRGVMGDCGFEPGGYVTADGGVRYENPWDNPLQCFAGCFS